MATSETHTVASSDHHNNSDSDGCSTEGEEEESDNSPKMAPSDKQVLH